MTDDSGDNGSGLSTKAGERDEVGFDAWSVMTIVPGRQLKNRRRRDYTPGSKEKERKV